MGIARTVAAVTLTGGLIAGCGGGGESQPQSAPTGTIAENLDCDVNLKVGDVVRGAQIPPEGRVLLTGVRLSSTEGVARPLVVLHNGEAAIAITGKNGETERIISLKKVEVLGRGATAQDFCKVPNAAWLPARYRTQLEGVTLTNTVNGEPSFKDPGEGVPLGLQAATLSEALEKGAISQIASMKTLRGLGYRVINLT